MQRFVVPVPFKAENTTRVQQYLDCTWKPNTLPLIDFLRMTNQAGQIHKKLQKRWEQAKVLEPTTDALEPWAVAQPLRGDTLIAAVYLSRYNDEYYGQWLLMNKPFGSLEEFLKPELNLVPDHLYYQTMAYLISPEHWCNEAAVRAQLEQEAFREHHVRNIWAMLQANQALIRQYLEGNIHKDDDVVAAPAGEKPPLETDQRNIVREIVDHVKEGLQARQVQEGVWKGDSEQPRADPFAEYNSSRNQRQAFTVLGPAGSGKTSCIEAAVEEVEKLGGKILIAAPTGKLAARFRQKYPHLAVDTIHGAFSLWKPLRETLELMLPYDLIIIEEVGQLSREIFERLIQLWLHAERLPTLVFIGDFWQLPGVDPSKAFDSPLWRMQMFRHRKLNVMRRCECKILESKLRFLRTGKPDKRGLEWILRGHKAPRGHARANARMYPPTAWDIKMILQQTPKTTFLTVSRRAAALLNQWAVQALFSEARPVGYLPLDLTEDEKETPKAVPIYVGMRVTLTRNLNKRIGFVNGMGAEVLALTSVGIEVITDQGTVLMIHPWTNEFYVRVFPCRLGYATTLHKVQGATLDHITLWMDVKNMPAAAYVALSRVRKDADWCFIDDPTCHHFTPARFD